MDELEANRRSRKSAWATLQRLRKFLREHGTRIGTPEDRTFETEGEVIESGFRLTVAGRDAVMRSLIRAVYRFRDATLVNEKKDDFGSALQNLYRELERAENLAAQSFLAAWARDRKLKTRAREVLQLCSHPVIGWQELLLASSVCGLFKWRQFEPEVILLAVGWYLRFSLSYRDVEELLAERGLHADHVTVWRWVQRYAPELQRCLRRHLKPTNDSWRMDETYVRVKGKWRYLYRAVDSSGATLDFLLSAKQDAAAAKRFLAKALGGANHPAPRVINTDGHAAYPSAVAQLKGEGDLTEDCRHRPVPYLNNVLEQDHRAIKRRVNASQHFRSFCAARRTLAGYEAIHMIRKGQASGSASAPGIGLLHRFILGLFAATS